MLSSDAEVMLFYVLREILKPSFARSLYKNALQCESKGLFQTFFFLLLLLYVHINTRSRTHALSGIAAGLV